MTISNHPQIVKLQTATSVTGLEKSSMKIFHFNDWSPSMSMQKQFLEKYDCANIATDPRNVLAIEILNREFDKPELLSIHASDQNEELQIVPIAPHSACIARGVLTATENNFT